MRGLAPRCQGTGFSPSRESSLSEDFKVEPRWNCAAALGRKGYHGGTMVCVAVLSQFNCALSFELDLFPLLPVTHPITFDSMLTLF